MLSLMLSLGGIALGGYYWYKNHYSTNYNNYRQYRHSNFQIQIKGNFIKYRISSYFIKNDLPLVTFIFEDGSIEKLLFIEVVQHLNYLNRLPLTYTVSTNIKLLEKIKSNMKPPII